ncbi:protein LURP-one-related 5 [Ricinus communis]|uniref:GTP binding protein, putative n=1 Tax=Ricinus communis TaxID=3988 RepID=B9S1W0_RICCO|nr:protein LURP-one-related 5 [Ricinus communis]EEF42303.1 GTP binding protein, putative [Ricinus communis]|eukprot:XP_002519979.1 protein LURP-one-related 5 [Ricinus communis]
MSKIHPAEKRCQDLLLAEKENNKVDRHGHRKLCTLTVWKRSSMSFQGTDGFTVFDTQGKLVFRVDNYSRKNRHVGSGLVLMDGVGNALLTLKPQIMSMQYQWNAYRGEYGCGTNSKLFSMRSSSVIFHTGRDVSEIFMGGLTRQCQNPDFRIEGSFRARDCKIKSASDEVVAKMSRKRVNTTVLLSDDVFSLVVKPGFDTQLIMAFVVVLDRISNKPFTPVLCS